jgi:uncharacterized protein (TIGR02266 family)
MQSRRIDLEREISIRVPAFDSFITEYSANVSTTGMFIRSEKPLPADTQLGFEFKVADDWKLIRGMATVVWSRYRDEGPDRPAGMGVLFTEIDPQSRRLIQWIIEKHVREGGVPFDLGELRESYNEDLVEMAETEKDVGMPPPVTRVMERPKLFVEPPPKKRRAEPVKFRLIPLIGAGVLVTALLAGLFWISEKSAQSAANPDLAQLEPGSVSEAAGSTEPAEATPAASTAEASEADDSTSESAAQAATQEPPPEPTTQDVPAATPSAEPETTPEPALGAAGAAVAQAFDQAAQRVVGRWAKAWSDQDVQAYLAHYATSFQPPGGQSRSDWEAVRAQRLGSPEFIRITVSDMQTELDDGTHGRATFIQSYESDRFEDSVRKTLDLVREDGRWKIAGERSTSG